MNPCFSFRPVLFRLLLGLWAVFQFRIMPAQSLEYVDMSSLVREIQYSKNERSKISMVWWIPFEYFQVSFEKSGKMSEAQIESMLQTFQGWIVVGVIKGEMKISGLRYDDLLAEKDLRKLVSFTDKNGNVLKPVKESDIPEELNTFLLILKPILANMMGDLGESFHFVVFKGEDKNENRLDDPFTEGILKVKLEEDEFRFRTPLSSLLPPQFCPVDNEKMGGNWKFCPWHGVPLK